MQLDKRFDKLEYYEIEIDTTQKWKWAYSYKAFRTFLTKELKDKKIKRIFVELECFLWSVSTCNLLDCTTVGGQLIVLFDDKALIMYIYAEGVFKYKIVPSDDIIIPDTPLFNYPPKHLMYLRQRYFYDIKDRFELSYEGYEVIKINVEGTHAYADAKGFDEEKAEKYAVNEMLPRKVVFTLENGNTLEIIGDDSEYFLVNMKEKAFCDEAITGICRLTFDDIDDHTKFSSHLNTYKCLEYHITKSEGLIFRTRKNCIVVSSNGVFKYASLSKLDSLRIKSYPISEDLLESTVCGQKLISFDISDNRMELSFSDLKITVCFHESKEEIDIIKASKFRGSERLSFGSYLLKEICTCEGKGEAYFNVNSGYKVRCSSCHLATSFYNKFSDAVLAWNRGNTESFFETDKERFRDSLCEEQYIKYISLHDSGYVKISDREVICESISVVFSSKVYTISCYKLSNDTWDFTLDEDESEPTCYSNKIVPHSRLVFQRFIDGNDRSQAMRFVIDDCDIDVSATSDGLRVLLSKIGIYDLPDVKKRKALLE